MSEHKASISWKLTSPDFLKGKYSRAHTWTFDGGATIAASPSPSVVPAPYSNPAHVDPEEAVQIYEDLVAPHRDRPLPIMLGIHWGTFRLTEEPMEEPPQRASARWRAAGLDEDRLWIARFGETRRLR